MGFIVELPSPNSISHWLWAFYRFQVNILIFYSFLAIFLRYVIPNRCKLKFRVSLKIIICPKALGVYDSKKIKASSVGYDRKSLVLGQKPLILLDFGLFSCETNDGFDVFGLREHIIGLNTFNFIIPRKRFSIYKLRIGRVFHKLPALVFDKPARQNP